MAHPISVLPSTNPLGQLRSKMFDLRFLEGKRRVDSHFPQDCEIDNPEFEHGVSIGGLAEEVTNLQERVGRGESARGMVATGVPRS